ncbi:uncharacterized protein RSE6_12232 [Rhynchosporium secalis]|uniref:2EXR domain-containing protein n=1 Tax=Rhynchosporium secalis TaxID=38038 RepID=A0A1E1MPV4_RHYSE|nr:uncharacterized protein RSE6_12232 [Rhynchosporium secalis]
MKNLGNPGKDSGEPSSAVRTPSKPSGDDPRCLKAPSLPSEGRRSIQRSSTTFAPRHPWVADTLPTSVPSELASRSSRSAKLAKIQISQSNHRSMTFSTTAIAATPVILEVFTTFPELPLELRHKIWFYALPDARVIEVDFHENIKKWMCRHESQPNPSGMLRTNKESRKEFFRNYVPFFNVTKNAFYSKNVHNLWPDSVSYFCPDIDTL